MPEAATQPANSTDLPPGFKETEIGPLPEGWEIVPFDRSILRKRVTLGFVSKQAYQTHGRFPVVDQGQEFIAGYADDSELVYSGDLPVIVFGDHTRVSKLVDFPFICGAQCTRVLAPNRELYDPTFLYLALSHTEIPSRGYNRHYTLLRDRSLPCPPPPEQRSIAAVLGAVDRKIAAEENRKAALEALFKTMLHLLMTGRVRVKGMELQGAEASGR